MNMKKIFEEFYTSQENEALTEYTLEYWDELLAFMDNDPEKMLSLINLASQCIQINNKDIYTRYTNNLIGVEGES